MCRGCRKHARVKADDCVAGDDKVLEAREWEKQRENERRFEITQRIFLERRVASLERDINDTRGGQNNYTATPESSWAEIVVLAVIVTFTIIVIILASHSSHE